MSARGTYECLFCDLVLPWSEEDADDVDWQMREHLRAAHAREAAALRAALAPSPPENFETGEPA